MKKRVILMLFCALLGALLVAQTRTGNIYGKTVLDDGTAVPGVLATLESPVQGKLTTVSSVNGNFRFLSLPPDSDYTLTLELEGFKKVVKENLRVKVGENLELIVEMVPGEIVETISIMAATPMLDSRKTTAATNVTQELLQTLPTARDPWAILEMVPGLMSDVVNVGGNESGQQANYASRGEGQSNSQWNVDGVEVTDPTAPGTSGMYYDYDMFEEMQIQTAANDVTAMTGGVNINFVTRRGSNKIGGGARFYLTDEALQGENLPDIVTQEDLSGNLIDSILDYGLNVGGPMIQDKAWYWFSYGVQDIGLSDMGGDPDETLLRTVNGKFNFNLGSHRLEIYGVYNDKVKEGRKRYPLDEWEASRKQTGPAFIFKIQDEFMIGNDLMVSLKGSYTPTSYQLEPYGGRDIPVYEEYKTYRYNTGTWEEYASDVFAAGLQLDYFKEDFLMGDHEILFGVDFRTSSSLENSQLGNGLHGMVRPGRSLYYAVLYREWLLEYQINRLSAFFQDTVNLKNLTLNLGLRYDFQKGGVLENTIPGTSVDVVQDIGGVDYNYQSLTQPALDLPFDYSFFSPRLGFIWDLQGDGKTNVKGNFSIYGSVLDAGILADSFLIDSYIDLDWYDDNNNLIMDAGELYYYKSTDNSDSVLNPDPDAPLFSGDLDPERTMELVLGIDRELGMDVKVGFNYIYRRIYNVNWTVPYVWDGGYRPVQNSDWQQYSEPVDGMTYYFWDTPDVYDEGFGQLTKRPDYAVRYDGFEFTFSKRLSNKWMLNAAFTYQNTWVNYDSEDAYIDPTDHQPADLLNGQPGPHSYNTFVMNSRWMFKLNGLMELPWGINLAGKLYAREGYVFPEVITLYDAGIYGGRRNWDADDPVSLTSEFGSQRYPVFWMVDLRLEKAVPLKNMGTLIFSLDAFNITNNNMTLSKGNDLSISDYDIPLTILNPRVIRLGVRYNF